MSALLMGIVGFGLGLFFGWVLHRERVTRAGSGAVRGAGDPATAALADASAQMDLADEDVVELQAQLSDAQQLLDERGAVIAELEAQLAQLRGEPVEQDVVAEPAEVGVADVVSEESAEELAEAVTTAETGATPDDTDVAEADVTDELVAPTAAEGEVVATPPVEEEAEPQPDQEPEETTDEIERIQVEQPAEPEPDDLRRIRGIGPAMERLLNEQGIVTFRQLALLDDAGVKELEAKLPGVPGRIRRDRWVEQARDLHVETHGDQP